LNADAQAKTVAVINTHIRTYATLNTTVNANVKAAGKVTIKAVDNLAIKALVESVSLLTNSFCATKGLSGSLIPTASNTANIHTNIDFPGGESSFEANRIDILADSPISSLAQYSKGASFDAATATQKVEEVLTRTVEKTETFYKKYPWYHPLHWLGWIAHTVTKLVKEVYTVVKDVVLQSECSTKEEGTYNNGNVINLNGSFIYGKSVMPEIHIDALGNIQGLPDTAYSVDREKKVITITDLFNGDGGGFFIKAGAGVDNKRNNSVIKGNINIVHGSGMAAMKLVNESDYTVEFSSDDLSDNVDVADADLIFEAADTENFTQNNVAASGQDHTTCSITSHGDVVLANNMTIYGGTLLAEFFDGASLYTKNGVSVQVNKFIVRNAKKVSDLLGSAMKLQMYSVMSADKKIFLTPEISVDADEAIALNLLLVRKLDESETEFETFTPADFSKMHIAANGPVNLTFGGTKLLGMMEVDPRSKENANVYYYKKVQRVAESVPVEATARSIKVTRDGATEDVWVRYYIFTEDWTTELPGGEKLSYKKGDAFDVTTDRWLMEKDDNTFDFYIYELTGDENPEGEETTEWTRTVTGLITENFPIRKEESSEEVVRDGETILRKYYRYYLSADWEGTVNGKPVSFKAGDEFVATDNLWINYTGTDDENHEVYDLYASWEETEHYEGGEEGKLMDYHLIDSDGSLSLSDIVGSVVNIHLEQKDGNKLTTYISGVLKAVAGALGITSSNNNEIVMKDGGYLASGLPENTKGLAGDGERPDPNSKIEVSGAKSLTSEKKNGYDLEACNVSISVDDNIGTIGTEEIAVKVLTDKLQAVSKNKKLINLTVDIHCNDVVDTLEIENLEGEKVVLSTTKEGNLSIGEITAEKEARIHTADGNILSGKTSDVNVKTSMLSLSAGGRGKSVGQEGKPLTINVTGDGTALNAFADKDIYLDSKGEKPVKAETIIATNGTLDLTTAGDFEAKTLSANEKVKAEVGGNAYIQGIATNGEVDLSADGSLKADRLTSGKGQTLRGGQDVTLQEVKSGNEVTVKAEKGNIYAAKLEAGEDVELAAGQDISVREIKAGGVINADAGRDLSLGAPDGGHIHEANAGNDASFIADGDLTIDHANAGNTMYIVVRGGDLKAGEISEGKKANLEASVLTITATEKEAPVKNEAEE
ncbi:MAG: hypothetical protein ACSW75_01710, partial [Lachnospiraceae bacterium]